MKVIYLAGRVNYTIMVAGWVMIYRSVSDNSRIVQNCQTILGYETATKANKVVYLLSKQKKNT